MVVSMTALGTTPRATSASILPTATGPSTSTPASSAGPSRAAGLALEPGTRRRMRRHGGGASTGDGVSIELEQVYSNPPKYLATRHVAAVVAPAPVRTRARLSGSSGSAWTRRSAWITPPPLRWALERPARNPPPARRSVVLGPPHPGKCGYPQRLFA